MEQYFALRHLLHLANSRAYASHLPQRMLAHWRIPPCASSLRHALRMMTPAQYCTSVGCRGVNGSSAGGRYVNDSTSEKMLVGGRGARRADEAAAEDDVTVTVEEVEDEGPLSLIHI